MHVMKTRGKRKFFKCLEPLVGTDVPAGKSKRAGGDATETVDYLLGSGQGCGGGAGADVIAGFLNGGFPKDSREKSRRSFSRVIKAVLFEKSLIRKFRKKGSSHPSSEPLTSADSSPATDYMMKKFSNEKSLAKETWSGADDFVGGNTSDSSDTSLFSSSTSASTSCTSSRSASERKSSSPRSVTFIEPKPATFNEEASSREPLVLKSAKPATAARESLALKPARPVTTTVTKRYNSNIMCFIVLSLMALVFWGKALAIVFTSAWLYMVPRSFEWVADSPEIDSDEVYWSKIVNERMSEETSLVGA